MPIIVHKLYSIISEWMGLMCTVYAVYIFTFLTMIVEPYNNCSHLALTHFSGFSVLLFFSASFFFSFLSPGWVRRKADS